MFYKVSFTSLGRIIKKKSQRYPLDYFIVVSHYTKYLYNGSCRVPLLRAHETAFVVYTDDTELVLQLRDQLSKFYAPFNSYNTEECEKKLSDFLFKSRSIICYVVSSHARKTDQIAGNLENKTSSPLLLLTILVMGQCFCNPNSLAFHIMHHRQRLFYKKICLQFIA